MSNRLWFITIPIMLILVLFTPLTAQAKSRGTENVSTADTYVSQALAAANQDNLAVSKQTYQKFHNKWLVIEDTVKDDSAQAYTDIESNMGQVEYAFITGKQQDVVTALKGLQSVDHKYVQGGYASGSFKKQNITLTDFLAMLSQTKEKVAAHDQNGALAEIAGVRQSWLSVEGSVVAQSATVYNDSERDMVTVNAMISAGNYQGADELLGKMTGYLTPLASKTGYTMWDAAMIPIREGLEALLVVAALLTYVKRSKEKKGEKWIWLGSAAGLALSAVLAVIVKFVFSSGAFGQNNFLISGWTGVFAAAMLLYMSYWLHSKSNISEWNKYIRSKSQTALDTGRLVSLGILAFLAIFREGTETVLFIIGMADQISFRSLLLGILIGLAVLSVIAYLMLFVGVKLPIRPFFLVSSLIVFYLCLKFAGLGIHSLQLGGMIPSTTSPGLPSIDFLGFFPTWQSAIPQLAIVLFAVVVFVFRKVTIKRRQAQETM
jgi:high-affinity iron transporter